MFERVLTVKYLTLKNSFIYLPSSFKYFKTGSCVQLTYGENKVAYFSVTTPTVKLDNNSVGLNSLYAKALGIKEDELVTLSEIAQLPTINSITISPVNNHDYDILEMLAETIQSTLLDQIRVVNIGQKFVVWIGVNINVVVHLENVSPVTPGMIDFLTEVVIKPTSSSETKNQKQQNLIEKHEKNSVFNITKIKSLTYFDNYQTENINTLQTFRFKQRLIYRLVGLEDLPFVEKLKQYCKLFNVFVAKENLPKEWCERDTLTTPIFCSLALLTNDVFSEKTVYVRLCIVEDFVDGFDLHLGQNLFVNNVIFETFQCQLGARVTMEYVAKMPFVNEVNIYTKKNYLLNVKDKFKAYLAESTEDIFVLNSDVVINIGENLRCSLKFSPVEAKFCVMDDKLTRDCKYVVHEEIITSKEERINVPSCDNLAKGISNYQTIINKIVSSFSVNENDWENVLIIGKPGTGKTTLLNIVKQKLKLYPNFIYTETIYCKTIKGKTLDSLFKVFSTAYSQLVLFQPSVLILDDLHVLCECVIGEENAPNALYLNRVSEMLHNFLKIFSNLNKIGICAATESISKLNRNIYTSRGSHLFKNLYSINDFTKIDRIHFLKHFFEKYGLTDVSFDELSVKTEGFVIQDIVDFYNKTIFEVYKHQDSDTEDVNQIENRHLEKALKNTCVLSLQNVQLHSPGDKNFADIGGLHDVKKTLVESLLWPAQYPSIFANAPLRLQSGLLLYGPPGTGKTLLAAAAAKHCGLRLISIKGPELLSKYIGASEQAVRDVFQKAQSARPCILFFDEFDSLAPRRGHDNTGVTDRVVNQFLTQLDGIESLSGVCVLAATSRPDLLDPALLRPGRLDRQILCPLPDKQARLEILMALSKNLDLSDDVDLEVISSSTEGYSGADLQSILYTAQLSTFDHLLENSKDSTNVIPQITQTHLEEALRKTRPSLTSQEKLKYEKIYTKFQGGAPTEDFKAGSKATLA